MKGLLLKDLYIGRKGIGVYLMMIVIFAIARSGSAAIFALFYAIMIPINLISIDERDRFDRLLPAMPVSGVSMVLDKYVVSWAMVGIAGVVYFVRGLFPGMELDLPVLLIGMSIALISQSISLPLIYRFGIERGRMIYLIAIMGQAAVLGALGALWEDYLALAVPQVIVVPLALCVGIGMSVGSVFVSSRVYAARCTA